MRALDAIFGYDFFISYTRRDGGKEYAEALARSLKQRGFQIFFDSDEYAMGDDWKVEGRWALRRTTQLILVASPEALSSPAVVREVEIYSSLPGRRIIPIDFGGTIRHRDESKPIFEYLKPEILFIEERPDCLGAQPSDLVLQKIRDGFKLKRQDKKRSRILAVVALVLVVLTILASVAAVVARSQQQEAVKQRDLAQQREKENRQATGRSHFLTATDALRRDEGDLALAYLARAVQVDPENASASTRLLTLLGQRNWPLPLRSFSSPFPVRRLFLHPDHRRLVIGSSRDPSWELRVSGVEVRDWPTGRLLAPVDLVRMWGLEEMKPSQNGSTFAAERGFKGRHSTSLSLLPPVEGGPLEIPASRADGPAQEMLDFEALAPSGKFAVLNSPSVNGGQEEPDFLAVLPSSAYHAERPQFDLTITFGQEGPPVAPGPDAPKPRATVRIAEIDSRDSVLAVGCQDEAVLLLGKDGALWKVELSSKKARRMATLASKDGAMPALAAFSNRGDRLAILFEEKEGGSEPGIRIFDLATARMIAHGFPTEASKLVQPKLDVSESDPKATLSFLPNDGCVVLYGTDGRGGWWNVGQTPDEKELEWHDLPPGSTLAAETPLAIARNDKFARLLDANSGAPVCGVARHEDAVTEVTVLDGSLFATGTEAGETRIWVRLPATLTAPAGKPRPEPGADDPEPPLVLAVRADHSIVRDRASENDGSLGEATLIVGGRTVKKLSAPVWSEHGFQSAAFSPDGRALVMTGRKSRRDLVDDAASGAEGDGESAAGAMIFSATDGSPASGLLKHEDCRWAGYDPGGGELATAGGSYVQFWDARTGEPSEVRLAHRGVSRAIWNPRNSQQLLTIAEGDSLRLWDLKTRGVAREVPWPAALRVTKQETSYWGPITVPWVAFDDTGKRFLMLAGPAGHLLGLALSMPLRWSLYPTQFRRRTCRQTRLSPRRLRFSPGRN